MKKKTINSLLCSILVCGIISGCSSKDTSETLTIAVKAENPKKTDFTLTDTYLADVNSENSVLIMPQLVGEVDKVFVTLGQDVKKGDALMTLDTEKVLDQHETADKNVKRATDARDLAIDMVSVKAPISGYIRSIEKNIGESISASTIITQIVDNEQMIIEIPFLTESVDDSFIGKEAVVTLSGTGEIVTGVVTKITGTPEFLYGGVQVNYLTISVDNSGFIKNGATANAMIGEISCSGSGTFESSGQMTVASGMNGTLDAVYVNSGDYVEAGDTIARVVNSGTQSQLNATENALTDALSFQQDMYELLEDHTIIAPIDGSITNLTVDSYDKISQTSVVAEVSSNVQKTISFFVTNEAMSHLEIGQEFSIENSSEKGIITEISSNADMNTGLFKVIGNLSDNTITSGSSAQISVASYQKNDALTLPYDSIVFESGNAYVYLFNDGIAKKTKVETGKFDSDTIIITSGITEEELVITSWSSGLRDGAMVQMEDTSHVDD